MGLLDRINITPKNEANKLDKEVKSFMPSFENNSIKKSIHITNSKERELKNKIQSRILEEFGNEQDLDKLVANIDFLAKEIVQNELEKARKI